MSAVKFPEEKKIKQKQETFDKKQKTLLNHD